MLSQVACFQMIPLILIQQVLLVTLNGTPVDYQNIHPLRPIENGPAKTDLYSRPQYKWDPSANDLGSDQNVRINGCMV